MEKLSGWTVTPWATRGVSVGRVKSYPPWVPGALPTLSLMVRVRESVFGLNSNTSTRGGIDNAYSTNRPLVVLSMV